MIQSLKAQYELNRQLTAGLRSVENNKEMDSEKRLSPLEIQIEGLERELKLMNHPSQIQINLLKESLTNMEDPLLKQVLRLEKELQLLLSEQEKLVMVSNIDGIIGSVNVKEGEKVSPFMPMLTIHAKTPSYVQGYIHENIHNMITIGDKVRVYSLSSEKNAWIEGEVIGVGSRIVEYPERLRVPRDLKIWGREVVVQIPSENGFLLGEKVRIRSLKLY
jgi:HlyD family secretion protein